MSGATDYVQYGAIGLVAICLLVLIPLFVKVILQITNKFIRSLEMRDHAAIIESQKNRKAMFKFRKVIENNTLAVQENSRQLIALRDRK